MSLTISVISDFNAAMVAGYLANRSEGIALAAEVAPYGQVYQGLLADDPTVDLSLVWTRPEGVIPAFRRALDIEVVRHDDVLAEVDEFASAVIRHAQGVQHCLVSSWVLPPVNRGYGMLDWRPGLGLSNLLARMNLRLSDRLNESGNVFMLDASRWIQASPKPSSPKMWFAAKVPYSNATFEAAAGDIVHAIRAVRGASRRLVIVDLDHTLWGGVVGETGWEGLRLGGHDHVGEAFVGFQTALRGLARRGVQLAIVSKNEESVAIGAIDAHPEMVLRSSDFAGWRINWNDKAQNIVDLLDELRLGAGSAVFLDDNPAERERVRSALPELLVPEWPVDPSRYEHALLALGDFDVAAMSDEDRQRTAMYATERERRSIATMSESLEDYLGQLSTAVTAAPVDTSSLPRVAQLFNKTNQLNMATRRLTADDIGSWAAGSNRSMLALTISDRFGDLGLSGIVSVEVVDGHAEIVDFVLSCRVMGRRVEESMIHLAVAEARRLGARTLTARYVPTARNAPTLSVLRESSLAESKDEVFSWDADTAYPKPDTVGVVDGTIGA